MLLAKLLAYVALLIPSIRQDGPSIVLVGVSLPSLSTAETATPPAIAPAGRDAPAATEPGPVNRPTATATSGGAGWMAHGQIAALTGLSADSAWWQLDCPSDGASRW